MESCGVSYVLSKTIDADTRNKQPFNPYQPSVASVLKLDPAFDQLLDFGECEELASRHPVVTQEMRQLLHTEQRKLSIQLKVRMDTECFA